MDPQISKQSSGVMWPSSAGTTNYEIFKSDYYRLRININYEAFVKVVDEFVFFLIRKI